MARRRPPLPDIVLTDPRSIRALAHPARVVAIDALYGGATLTATECAELAGLSPSAMSYHLRALERAGVVRRADPPGDGRQRPWEAAGRALMVDATLGGATASPATRAAEGATLSALMDLDREAALRWLVDPDRDWSDNAVYQRSRLVLTEQEAVDLEAAINALVTPYRRGARTAPAAPSGATREVRLAVLLVPTRT